MTAASRPGRTRPPADPLLTWPDGRGLCSHRACFCAVIAVPEADHPERVVLVDPSAAERRWLWGLFRRYLVPLGLLEGRPFPWFGFAPGAGEHMQGHECPEGVA